MARKPQHTTRLQRSVFFESWQCCDTTATLLIMGAHVCSKIPTYIFSVLFMLNYSFVSNKDPLEVPIDLFNPFNIYR